MRDVRASLPWTVAAALAVVLLPMLSGCHRTFREELISTGMSGPNAPTWVNGNPQHPEMPDNVFFVGRSVGYNVLDERSAVAAAREDVYRQMSELIATRVLASQHEVDARANGETHFRRWGLNGLTGLDDQSLVRTLPGDELRQAIAREASAYTHTIVGDLIDQDVHFEKWAVLDEPRGGFGRGSRGMYRYKCWVLMSIPKNKLEQRIREFHKLAEDAYERYVAEYERKMKWEEEDRQRAIADAEANRAHQHEMEIAHVRAGIERQRDIELEKLELQTRLAELHLGWLREARRLALEDRELRIQREEDARHWAREDQVEDRAEARELRRIMAIDRAHYRVKNH